MQVYNSCDKLYKYLDKFRENDYTEIVIKQTKGAVKIMKRSVYSLVLADDVIAEIDKLAFKMNTSRSNLINQILAERVQLMTPEMRMREIFSRMESLMGSPFQAMSQTSDAVLALRKSLNYKYYPTIKYSFELFRSFSGCVGRLKVNFRTQSKSLIDTVSKFFELWAEIEEKYVGKYFTNGVPCRISDGRLERDFYEIRTGGLSDKEISDWVSGYIQLIDRCIQLYVDNCDKPSQVFDTIEKMYIQNLKDGTPIL